jgi:hypothetical protein
LTPQESARETQSEVLHNPADLLFINLAKEALANTPLHNQKRLNCSI